MEKIKGKHKHLDLSDRIVIEASISAGSSLREIADRLHKDPTTISKELRRHRIEKKPRTSIHHIRCVNQKGCKKKNLCGGICSGRCSKCPLQNCFKICPDYAATTCEKSKRAPYVCNGCKKIAECVSARYFYSAKSADAMYQDTLKTSRTGINMTAEEMVSLDQLVTPLILRGQSLAHIYAAHRSEIPCSQRTLYNYIDHQLLAARNIDLPRKVRYRPRKKKRAKFDQEYLNGRKYEDFKLYLQEHPETEVVEIDTVHGIKGGKVMLTMMFRSTSLMHAFVMDTASAGSVAKVFDWIKDSLGYELFQKTFPVFLTDNGSEFKALPHLFKAYGQKSEIEVFFCDPYQAGQKGRLEKNHEFIRYVLPKGSSFDHLTQADIDLLVNNINSIARASLDGNTPFQLASLHLDTKVLDTFGLYALISDEVLLKPSLLRR